MIFLKSVKSRNWKWQSVIFGLHDTIHCTTSSNKDVVQKNCARHIEHPILCWRGCGMPNIELCNILSKMIY